MESYLPQSAEVLKDRKGRQINSKVGLGVFSMRIKIGVVVPVWRECDLTIVESQFPAPY